jgi:hypothetical protein
MSDSKEKMEETAGRADGEKALTISERKLLANRENAKRSTGPRTAQGKSRSRFNATKHGLLSKQILFSPDGKLLDEGLYELLESLRNKYGRGDVRTELLIEGIVADQWRNRQGLQYEIEFLGNGKWHFGPHGNMLNIQRYTSANRRAILKSLELLEELQPADSVLETGLDPHVAMPEDDGTE